MHIDRMLARPGLEPATRLLVFGIAAIWRGDWDTLQAAARSARARGVPRASFEELLLQAVLFCGFPRVVTAFEEVGRAWPGDATLASGELPAAAQRAAGEALFATIYGANAPAVAAMLRGFHPDFHAFVFDVAYGRVLSRPGLPARTRELLAVGALAASDQPRQFAGHARGARRLGVGADELREVLITVFGGDEERTRSWLHRVPTGDAPSGEGPADGSC